MVLLPAAAILMIGQSSDVEDSIERWTVVARTRPPQEIADRISHLNGAEIGKVYEAHGFTKIVRGKHTYLFAKNVWQEDRIVRKLKGLSELAAKMAKDGVVSAAEVPDLADFVGFAFAAMHAEIGQDSSLQLAVRTNVTVTANGRAISLVLPGFQGPSLSEGLKAHPLRSNPTDPSKVLAADDIEPAVDIHFDDYGLGTREESTQMRDYQSAMGILADHFKDYDDKNHGLQELLAKKLVGHSLTDLRNGSLSDLGQSASQAVQLSITHFWQQYGFSDSGEASKFLSNCSVSTGSTLVLAGSTGKGDLQFGLH